jgi:hypothetical protein
MNNERLERMRRLLTPITLERAREIARERVRMPMPRDALAQQQEEVPPTDQPQKNKRIERTMRGRSNGVPANGLILSSFDCTASVPRQSPHMAGRNTL